MTNNVIPELVLDLIKASKNELVVSIVLDEEQDVIYSFDIPGKYGKITLYEVPQGLVARTRYSIEVYVYGIDDIFDLVLNSARTMQKRMTNPSENVIDFLDDTWRKVGIRLGRIQAKTETKTTYTLRNSLTK